MRSEVQEALLESLAGVLRPIASLMLKCGLGYTDFASAARSVFVETASEEYGIRGRPTNVSRVAAMTGISRKEIRRLRAVPSERWTPDMQSSPINVVLHYWHCDPDFSFTSGNPKQLRFEGDRSFSSLVRRYVGDIPPGAVKTELQRSGAIVERQKEGVLRVNRRYVHSANFQPDLVRSICYSLRNLATTVVYNAELTRGLGLSHEDNEKYGRFERIAWSDHLDSDAQQRFKKWSRQEASIFIEKADNWIGQNELEKSRWEWAEPRAVGIGLYYFEEEP